MHIYNFPHSTQTVIITLSQLTFLTGEEAHLIFPHLKNLWFYVYKAQFV